MTTCLWSVRDPDLDRVPSLWWRRSNSSPLSSEPWHLLLLRDLNPNIFLYLTGGALKGLTPVVHQSSWWQNTSMHKIIRPQSMIKCRPCQNSPAPRLLLLFCSPLVLHLLLLLTGRFTFKQYNNVLCNLQDRRRPIRIAIFSQRNDGQMWQKKQVFGINPPAFSCCLVFLGALPAASASFFFWLFDFGGMIFLFFSKILKLARKVALQNDNAAVTWPELSLKIQLKVIITMVAKSSWWDGRIWDIIPLSSYETKFSKTGHQRRGICTRSKS